MNNVNHTSDTAKFDISYLRHEVFICFLFRYRYHVPAGQRFGYTFQGKGLQPLVSESKSE